MAGGSSKIKLFKFIQQTYRDIGIFSPESRRHRSPINSTNWLILFSLAQLFTTSAAYLLVEADSMIGYGMAFFICSTVLLSTILYSISFWQIKHILNFIESGERFIEKSECYLKQSTMAYKDANERIERITELFARISFGSEIIYVLPPLLHAIVRYYFLGSGAESFILFFPTWWPFDWKTPFGYLIAWFAQCAGVAAIIIAVIPFFNVIFASSWLFIVIAEDLTNDMATFNTHIFEVQKDRDRAELMERFPIRIQHYADAKQLINDFNQICKYSMFTFFLWYMLTVSSLLVALQFQLWDDHSKQFEILILSMLIQWIFVLDLVTCESGERVTNRFDQFGVELGQFDWTKLPIKMQRMYLIFLSDTQQPKNIQSYAGIMCTRDTFKKITTNRFSYFMTLRNFGV